MGASNSQQARPQKAVQLSAPPATVVSASEAGSILSREDSDALPRDTTALRKAEEVAPGKQQRGDAKVMLLEALKKGDFELSRSLLATAGAEEVSFVRLQKGSWAEHTNESAIHHALFHLHEAIKEEDVLKWYELVLELIRKGAPVNSVYKKLDHWGSGTSEKAFDTILQWCIKREDDELLVEALKHGGDPNIPGIKEGHTMRTDGKETIYPIHTAVGQQSFLCIKTLAEGGADVNARYSNVCDNEYGFNQDTQETALHQIMGKGEYNRVGDDGSVEQLDTRKKLLLVITLLIDLGADIDAYRKELVQEFNPMRRGPRRETAFLQVIRLRQLNLVRLFRSYGADISATYKYFDSPDKSAYELAAEAGQETLKALQCVWEPQYHSFYAAGVRQDIFIALCVAKRQQWPLPREVLYMVLQWIGCPPFAVRFKKVPNDRVVDEDAKKWEDLVSHKDVGGSLFSDDDDDVFEEDAMLAGENGKQEKEDEQHTSTMIEKLQKAIKMRQQEK